MYGKKQRRVALIKYFRFTPCIVKNGGLARDGNCGGQKAENKWPTVRAIRCSLTHHFNIPPSSVFPFTANVETTSYTQYRKPRL
ncbi:hypothetical protein J6590_032935 [Homalodisca vitripennis]|nr:hypothetical protein J6590_032935 [Homalodisca vitripennis]